MKANHSPNHPAAKQEPSCRVSFVAKALVPSAAVLNLVRLCVDVRYGRIERLHIREGEPIFAPPPEVIRTVKFGGGGESAPPTPDKVLSKGPTQALLRELASLNRGCILRLEVRDGQPCFMEVALDAAGEATDV